MTNRALTFTFALDDRFSGAADAIGRKVGTLREKFAKFNSDLEAQGVTLKGVSDKLSSWASKMKWVSAGLVAAGGAAIVAASNYEKLAIQFEVLAGDSGKGRALLAELRDFTLAAGTVSGESVMNSAKAMFNYGYATEDVMKNLKMMTDIAVATDIPLEQIVDSIGRMKSEGHVISFGLRSLRQARFGPLLEALYSDKLSHKEFKKALAAGRIPFSALEKVMSDKSASFGDIRARIDATTGEQFDDTKSLIMQVTAEFGKLVDKQTNANTLAGQFNQRLISIRDNLVTFADANPGIVKIVSALTLALIVAAPLLLILSGMLSALAFIGVIATATGIAFGVLFGWIFVGFIAIVGAILLVIKYWDQLVALWGRTTDWVVNSGFGKAMQMMGMIDVTTNNKAAVDINVSADKGSSASASGQSFSPNLDIGLNMGRGASVAW